MKRDSIIFYRSFYEAINELEPQMQATVYTALFEYALNQNEIVLNGLPKAIFTLIKPQLDANNKRFENGNKGGRPKPKDNQSITKQEPKSNQKLTKQEPNVNDNVNDNDNLNVNSNENLNEKEKRIADKKSAPHDFVYSECMEIYNNFILDKTSLPAKVDGQQGKALKEIISYFKSIENVKNGERSVQDCISFVFKEWDRVEPFIKDKLKLSEINSNLTNIINQIKNGKSNTAISKQQKIANQHEEQRRRIFTNS